MTKIQFYLLILTSIGVVDEIFYHHFKHDLIRHKECLKENLLHMARYVNYFLIFNLTAHFEMLGNFAWLMIFIVFCDIIVGFLDIWVEPSSREKFGGLTKQEYLLHMMLSFMLGIFLFNFLPVLFAQTQQPTAFIYLGADWNWVRTLFTICSLGSVVMFSRAVYILKRT